MTIVLANCSSRVDLRRGNEHTKGSTEVDTKGFRQMEIRTSTQEDSNNAVDDERDPLTNSPLKISSGQVPLKGGGDSYDVPLSGFDTFWTCKALSGNSAMFASIDSVV